ncbi:hypothetical protein K438DRAFT_2115966 [Mycena galopus ATCC 62051]|nr:hypothetical protein K438DRAFT_2115966 [Mycena galopus ATCC 62051]
MTYPGTPELIQINLLPFPGEIAISVRYGLAIGAACTLFVLVLMYLAPVAYPIARLLDAVLGKSEMQRYKKVHAPFHHLYLCTHAFYEFGLSPSPRIVRRSLLDSEAELKSFLEFHRTGEESLRDDEISILNGVLEHNMKHVELIMMPMKDIVTLSADAIPDDKLVETMLLSGYSRFPVHEPHDPTLLSGYSSSRSRSSTIPRRPYQWGYCWRRASINFVQVLDYLSVAFDFIASLVLSFVDEKREEVDIISEKPAIGVITLDDIIILSEIIDETDRYQNNVTKRIASVAVTRGQQDFRDVQKTGNSTRSFEKEGGKEFCRDPASLDCSNVVVTEDGDGEKESARPVKPTLEIIGAAQLVPSHHLHFTKPNAVDAEFVWDLIYHDWKTVLLPEFTP